MIKRINLKDVAVSFFLSLIGVLLLKAYCDAVENQELSMLLKYTFCHLHSIKIWTAILFFAVILFFYKTNFKKINDFLYKYRFSIVFVCFILCVFFEITGSSLGLWNIYFGEKDKDVLFGVSRAIRSDEWAIFTPLGISQYYNYSGSFPYFSDTARACSTDVFIEYGQAVKNPLIIYRPFFGGYLFLPVAKGMAFFWCGRLFALMLVSFEFGLLLTNKNKLLSLTMAVLITYAPVVQWWFAINGLDCFETGGGMLNLLFLYVTNIWHTVLGEGAWGNICESSYFIDFFPVCWILPVLTLLNSQKKGMLLRFLLSVSIFLGIYCVFGFPRTLAKFSFLSNCQAGRVLVILGFCNVLLLIRTLSKSESICSSSFFKSATVAFVTIFIAVQACKALNQYTTGMRIY